jgi:hypothetical protein
VKRAAEFLDEEFLARWMDREAIGDPARRALRVVQARFVADGGPVDVRDLDAAAITELDGKDLIAAEAGHAILAYPFAARPTGFVVAFADGRERHACCAIDALGVPAMLGETCRVRARCHDCHEPMELLVSPRGPLDHHEAMAWVGRRGDVRAKASASL